jgi:phage shock protein PspC (stress-responsive transcriptional regulator)
MHMTTQRLRRSRTDKVIGGVAGGLGAYFGIASLYIRLGWLLFMLAGGAGVLAYLIAWTVIQDQDGRRTIMPLVLLVLVILLPFILVLLWFVPVTVTTTH